MSDTLKVICGKCQVGAQVIVEDDGETYAVCPNCDQRDKVEDAQRIAGEYYVEKVRAMLNKTMSDAAKGSKFLQFKPGSPLKGGAAFRWHGVAADDQADE